MRGRAILVIATLAATAASDATYAQLSPQGVIGGITRPFRQMLGHLGHFPRTRHHRAVAAEPRAAATAPREASSVSSYRLGWVGPPAWPNAYEDVLGFTFWPDDYASRLRGHGFDVIADTITGRFGLPRSLARTATTGAAVRNDADTENSENSLDQCGDTSNTASGWPSSRVEQILQLSDAQHAALEKIQFATDQSAKKIKADCRGLGPLAPSDRLRELVQTVWTVRDAGISMREPLKNFSETLTNTQKDSFVSRQPQKMSPPDPNTANDGMNKQYQACVSQNAERAERLIKEIEMRVRPDKDQAQSFENFHKISSDMAKMLIASCAQPISADPLARLDAANDQLTAINYAATTVQIAFDDFYLKLKNDQKTRFDSLAR
jgi:LTXXQ motif family protein